MVRIKRSERKDRDLKNWTCFFNISNHPDDEVGEILPSQKPLL